MNIITKLVISGAIGLLVFASFVFVATYFPAVVVTASYIVVAVLSVAIIAIDVYCIAFERHVLPMPPVAIKHLSPKELRKSYKGAP